MAAMKLSEGKAIIEEIALTSGICDDDFIAKAKASQDEGTLRLIIGAGRLKASLAGLLES